MKTLFAGNRDEKILTMARREASVEGYAAFQPITRGPVVAFLGIVAVGSFVPLYVLWQWFLRACPPLVKR